LVESGTAGTSVMQSQSGKFFTNFSGFPKGSRIATPAVYSPHEGFSRTLKVFTRADYLISHFNNAASLHAQLTTLQMQVRTISAQTHGAKGGHDYYGTKMLRH
jgi:hypothetical protein